MILGSRRTANCIAGPSRTVHSSAVAWAQQVLKQIEKRPIPSAPAYRPSRTSPKGKEKAIEPDIEEVKRNEVGVQLLSRKLHRQIFKGAKFPPPASQYVALARKHLAAHGLDPSHGSVLPDTSFTLPSLQGRTIDEHFYRIGQEVSRPWIDFAEDFSQVQLPPRPECWHLQSGWTRYHYHDDGSSYCEQVTAPDEDMLTFDVETLPSYGPYAIMACAASKNHWYSWLSPWLLGETEELQQLIPLGDAKRHRIVVGHNVSYDRARLLEEYSVEGSNTRFLDTLSLHVAVKGISSHQRPAWMKYRKSKNEAKTRQEEAIEASVDMLHDTQERLKGEQDATKRAELRRLQQDIEESLPQLESAESVDTEAAESSSKRWEEITSANSLADVAKLYCGIEVGKEIRDDFMTRTREEIVDNVEEYLDYCASDVASTHAVYKKVFPGFIEACPSPVSFAGILRMGSSFLTVNEKWEEYLKNAEGTYSELNEKIKMKLFALAKEAKGLMDDREKWENDPWLRQLDWSPKAAKKTRGIYTGPETTVKVTIDKEPKWYKSILKSGVFHQSVVNNILPLLLRVQCDGIPLYLDKGRGWLYKAPDGSERKAFDRASTVHKIMGKSVGKSNVEKGRLTFSNMDIGKALIDGVEDDILTQHIMTLANDVLSFENKAPHDPWLSQLDWSRATTTEKTKSTMPPVIWPKWYWDLAKPKKDLPPGTLDLTLRNRFAPLLLQLNWHGHPLVFSHEHGWTFRVDSGENHETRQNPLKFYDPADQTLQEETLYFGSSFYKLPHKDGESANVGSPFGKTFLKYAQDGTLTSLGGDAKEALDMNAQCSYWISSRDRILNQMVVWDGGRISLGAESTGLKGKVGLILPQVITMGAVTRRAIERTWLTASNAKKNRVGSELKAMVRAPKGYAIVGADVDSEELWISSAMGDAQFGLHGATALGWMTLEGTKSAGTDLHSKTASILGISRDQAKVFNYSRIYGAGMRHAILLLLQSNPEMLPEEASKQAEKLYTSTKGKNTHRTDVFGRKFWFGGSESYVFNKLEEIATSDRPLTPALGCGVTYALSKEYLPPGFGTDYMTSRINWVVQSSGVDYLHLLIVAMEYLTKKYDIDARYLISVHDELRYLVKESDKYRAAMALQIANLWTRSLFAYRLGMDDLPQGVAFFSAVDVDHVLRKEVDLPCVTPSQSIPIPPGESLTITNVLEKTNGGSLYRDGRSMDATISEISKSRSPSDDYTPPNCLVHRASSPHFLRAQAAADFGEVKRLAQLESGFSYSGDIGGIKRLRQSRRKQNPVSNNDSVNTRSSRKQVVDISRTSAPAWLDSEIHNYAQISEPRG